MANGGRAGYMGRPKYFTIYYRSTRSTRSLQENMRICQGNLREFSGTNCPTFIAMNQLAVKITRRSLSFGCICINSSTCLLHTKDRMKAEFDTLILWIMLSINGYVHGTYTSLSLYTRDNFHPILAQRLSWHTEKYNIIHGRTKTICHEFCIIHLFMIIINWTVKCFRTL